MSSQNDCQFVQNELSIKQPVDYSAIIVECMQYNNEFQERPLKNGAAPSKIIDHPRTLMKRGTFLNKPKDRYSIIRPIY